jgi:hypothetical protein
VSSLRFETSGSVDTVIDVPTHVTSTFSDLLDAQRWPVGNARNRTNAPSVFPAFAASGATSTVIGQADQLKLVLDDSLERFANAVNGRVRRRMDEDEKVTRLCRGSEDELLELQGASTRQIRQDAWYSKYFPLGRTQSANFQAEVRQAAIAAAHVVVFQQFVRSPNVRAALNQLDREWTGSLIGDVDSMQAWLKRRPASKRMRDAGDPLREIGNAAAEAALQMRRSSPTARRPSPSVYEIDAVLGKCIQVDVGKALELEFYDVFQKAYGDVYDRLFDAVHKIHRARLVAGYMPFTVRNGNGLTQALTTFVECAQKGASPNSLRTCAQPSLERQRTTQVLELLFAHREAATDAVLREWLLSDAARIETPEGHVISWRDGDAGQIRSDVGMIVTSEADGRAVVRVDGLLMSTMADLADGMRNEFPFVLPPAPPQNDHTLKPWRSKEQFLRLPSPLDETPGLS